METEKKIKHIWLGLIVITMVVLLRLDLILALISLGTVSFFIANLFAGKSRDNQLLLSSILGVIALFTLDYLRLGSNFFTDFYEKLENGFYIITSVTYLSFYWVTGLVYLYLLKRKPISQEYDKIQAMLSKISIQAIPDVNGRVEKICIILNKQDERYFYDIKPEFVINSTKYIDNIILNTKNPKFYGYDYAIRVFLIGNDEIFNWHIDN